MSERISSYQYSTFISFAIENILYNKINTIAYIDTLKRQQKYQHQCM